MAMAATALPHRFLFLTPIASYGCGLTWEICPPPPPPPLPPPPPDPSATHFGHSYLIPALPITAAFILALSALSIFVAIVILRRGRRRAATALQDSTPFEDHGGEGEVDHHVWYIRTTGLDEFTIASITAWAYKADDGILGGSPADCAVCLSEFRDGELLRLLPKCGHAFHVSCIDTWLRSHINCPLCRAPVVAQTCAASGADPGTTSSSFSSASSSPDFSVDHVQPHLISSGQVDTNHIDVQPPHPGHGNLEVETAGGRFEPSVRIPAMINQGRDSELRVPLYVGEHGFQPIRRSISLSSFIPAPSLNRSGLQEGISESTTAIFLDVEWIDRTNRKQVSTSNDTTYLQKETERTSSSASGRFFLSRHRRAGSSVLPL